MRTIGMVIAILSATAIGEAAESSGAKSPLLAGEYRWLASPPRVSPAPTDGGDWHAVKDPSIVRYGDRWHLFSTVRGKKRSHAIEYISFASWDDTSAARRRILPCHEGFFCAPQVFFFTPHKKWYLICQASDPSWDPPYRPAFSTTTDIARAESWSPLKPLVEKKADEVKAWLDFWVICDDAKAYLFFTSLDGKMWRAETKLADFPAGWSNPVVALRGDVFEASHTYRVKGEDRYLTLIEAQGGRGWRYYKAYAADRLDGEWTPIAAEKDRAFASMRNVEQPGGRWTDSISHAELIRAGFDEKLEVDPRAPKLLFQGVLDVDRRGKAYGEIPWRLGLLELGKEGAAWNERSR
ncbi:MAG: glycoside hydrolase [Planctomycetes bacterium]|nr:glycoside hydrolase [Planctomycetota bacterium]